MSLNVSIRSTGVFVLFADCIPVKGARRSVICDLQRRRLRFIPNALYDILTSHQRASMEEIRDAYPPSDHDTIVEYFGTLAREEFGFWTDEPQLFEDLDREWESAALCTNAIVDVSSNSNHDFMSIFGQLDALGCENIQVRILDELASDSILRIVEYAEQQRFRHMDLIAKSSEAVNWTFAMALREQHPILASVILHSSGEDRHTLVGNVHVSSTRSPLDIRRCGYVKQDLFVINTQHFMEARCANSCLNGKLGIGADGEIRACPSMPQSCGNVREQTLAAAIEKVDLRRLWGVTKDQVQVCKDCEFRYVCTDCRAHTKDGGLFSQPSSCTYNPYAARWE